jgi:class 3 adenylate cyclase
LTLHLLEKYWGTPASGQFFPSLAHDPQFCEALAKVLRASATPKTAAAQARYIYTQLDARSMLPLLQVPTLVMVNSAAESLGGRPTLRNLAFDTAQHIRGAKYIEIDDSDSMFFVRNNSQVIEEISEFLTGERSVPEPDRVLATVLFTDIVGSTERAATDGDQKWKVMLDLHDLTVRREISRFKGREIKHTGDGFFTSFDGPARAIRCARSIIERVNELGLAVRVGVHTGECEVRGTDLSGMAVHIAARIAALAGPSEIWVSSTVKDLVVGSELTFSNLGLFTLKGVPQEWSLYKAL